MNHISVQSRYARYRKALIEAGVELYEVRANAIADGSNDGGPQLLTLR